MKVLNLIACASIMALGVSLGAQAADGVVLWNKLGSVAEAQNSEIGADFTIVEDQGVVIFLEEEESQFGGAMATTGGTANTGPAGGYLRMNPDDFFPPDKTKGTVEFWVQKQLPEIVPYQTPMVRFFGNTFYATGYASIAAGWTEATPNTIQFDIYDGQAWHTILDRGWGAVPVEKWVHLAFVWDGAGIDGGPDDLRIYRDGALVASHQGQFSQIGDFCCIGYICGESQCSSGGYEVRVLSNHEGRRLTGCDYLYGYCPAAYMDNLVVWDYAKTDFSDRFTEDPRGKPADLTVSWASLRYPRHEEPKAFAEQALVIAQCVDLDPGPDNLDLTGTLTLSEDSDGLDPLGEVVSLTFGNYSVEIPAGFFVWRPEKQRYAYWCRQPSGRMWMTLKEVSSNEWAYRAAFNGIDASGTTTPTVGVKLNVGDDGGATEIRMSGKLWYYAH